MNKWQQVTDESLPAFQQMVLCWHSVWEYYVAYRTSYPDGRICWIGDVGETCDAPEYWQELPAPPERGDA